MNRKLRNTLSAVTATGAAWAIAMMVALPVETLPAGFVDQHVGNNGALANAVALSADIAAASALALDAEQDTDDQNHRGRRKGSHSRRQAVVMPYFSFSPRG